MSAYPPCRCTPPVRRYDNTSVSGAYCDTCGGLIPGALQRDKPRFKPVPDKPITTIRAPSTPEHSRDPE